jgi:acyl carrier protein
MSRSDVRSAIVKELGERGMTLGEGDDDVDLISVGVNSATVIKVLSTLEDRFDVDLVTEELFAGPITVARLEAELSRLLAS